MDLKHKLLFAQVINSNKKFFKSNFSENTNGILLYDMFYHQKQLIYGISKVALSAAKSLNLTPLGMLPLRSGVKTFSFAKSINRNTIDLRIPLVIEFVNNFKNIIKLLFQTNNKQKLIALKVDEVQIGSYIYDSLLRTFAVAEINVLNFAHKKRILLELLHFYFFKTVLKKRKIKFVVIGDNVYRYGLLFELCKKLDIPCIAAIDLNAFSMAKYLNREAFNFHPRQVAPNLLQMIKNPEKIKKTMDEYMNNRVNGNIIQHDVLSAYNNKITRSKQDFFLKYNLDTQLPVVVVMAHIFSDAPHGYPKTLYNDYAEWFQATIKILLSNKSVNLLVKEHPSVALYGEEGIVKSILKKAGATQIMILKEESTNSILQHANTIVTCGGTIGLEFSLLGKPTVLASHPPYAKLGFTIEFDDISNYESFLHNDIQYTKPLNIDQQKLASLAAWVSFELYNNYSDDLEIGPEKIMMGKEYNDSVFYKKIISNNDTLLADQKIFHKMNEFLFSPHIVMVNSQKLNEIQR